MLIGIDTGKKRGKLLKAIMTFDYMYHYHIMFAGKCTTIKTRMHAIKVRSISLWIDRDASEKNSAEQCLTKEDKIDKKMTLQWHIDKALLHFSGFICLHKTVHS